MTVVLAGHQDQQPTDTRLCTHMLPVAQAIHVYSVLTAVCTAVPYYPGGSLYARNPPVQKEVRLSLAFQLRLIFLA